MKRKWWPDHGEWFDVIQGLSEASSIEELEEMSRFVKVARSWRVVRCNTRAVRGLKH